MVDVERGQLKCPNPGIALAAFRLDTVYINLVRATQMLPSFQNNS